MVATSTAADCVRPRVAGDREGEILDATVEVLIELGYDRLTMDAVAKRARAGKATLYRRWESKLSLVVDAVERSKTTGQDQPPDTGTLRGDLIAVFSRAGGLASARNLRVMAQVIPAMQSDPDFAAEFRARIVAPKTAAMCEIYRRASARGELAPGADADVLGPALAAIVMHRSIVLGEPMDATLVARVVDSIILPAATNSPTQPAGATSASSTPTGALNATSSTRTGALNATSSTRTGATSSANSPQPQ